MAVLIVSIDFEMVLLMLSTLMLTLLEVVCEVSVLAVVKVGAAMSMLLRVRVKGWLLHQVTALIGEFTVVFISRMAMVLFGMRPWD